MFRRGILWYGICLLLVSFILLSPACDKKHEEVVLDNPFDPDNPETQGDPYNMRAEVTGDSVSVKWNEIPDIDGVAVYRSTSPDSGFERVGTSTSGEYMDTSVQPGETYYYELRAYRDNTDAPSSGSPAGVSIPDISPPTGTSITINDGAVATNNRSVTLKLSATDATDMLISNSSSLSGTWERYASSKSWILTSGDGDKTVYARFRDVDGNESDTVSDNITLDTEAPSGSIDINGGASVTISRSVTLTLFRDDASEMRISNSSSFAGTWETYASTKAWILTSGDGVKTVYAQLRDAAGNVSSTIQDSITLDTQKTGISINDGASFTTSRSVTLTLSSAGAAGMRISNSNSFTGGWETYASSKSWTLTAGDGAKTVYAQIRDTGGNVSGIVSDSIILDTQAPKGSITINGGESITASRSVTLELSADDASEMRIANSGIVNAAWESYAKSKNWTLTSGDEEKTVYAQFRDAAGNDSEVANDTITLRGPTDTMEGKDGAMMVLIPEGKFEMGDAFREGATEELPVHTVYVDAFYMDIYKVTNAQYAKFLNEYGKNTDASWHKLLDIDSNDCLIERTGNTYSPKSGYKDHPVIMVSWYGAAAYAQFYGKRLPTEAEWERAARGGLLGKRYPWGNGITRDDANYKGTGGKDIWNGTSPVGSFRSNGYGLYDMAGNVHDWCADEFDFRYYSVSPSNNPKGPDIVITFVGDDFTNINTNTSFARVLRGGTWRGDAHFIRVAYRIGYSANVEGGHVGFRCCASRSD